MELGISRLPRNGLNVLRNALHCRHGLMWTDGHAVYLSPIRIHGNTIIEKSKGPIKVGEFDVVHSLHWSCDVEATACYLCVVHSQIVSIWRVDGDVPGLTFKQVRKINASPIPQGCLWNPTCDVLCLLCRDQCSFYFYHVQKRGSYALPQLDSGSFTSGSWSKDGSKLALAASTLILVYSWADIHTSVHNFTPTAWRLHSPAGAVSCIACITNTSFILSLEFPLEKALKPPDSFLVPGADELNKSRLETDENGVLRLSGEATPSLVDGLMNLKPDPQVSPGHVAQLLVMDVGSQGDDPHEITRVNVDQLMSPDLLIYSERNRSAVVGSNAQKVLQIFAYAGGKLQKTRDISLDKGCQPKGVCCTGVQNSGDQATPVLVLSAKHILETPDHTFLPSSSDAGYNVSIRLYDIAVAKSDSSWKPPLPIKQKHVYHSLHDLTQNKDITGHDGNLSHSMENIVSVSKQKTHQRSCEKSLTQLQDVANNNEAVCENANEIYIVPNITAAMTKDVSDTRKNVIGDNSPIEGISNCHADREGRTERKPGATVDDCSVSSANIHRKRSSSMVTSSQVTQALEASTYSHSKGPAPQPMTRSKRSSLHSACPLSKSSAGQTSGQNGIVLPTHQSRPGITGKNMMILSNSSESSDATSPSQSPRSAARSRDCTSPSQSPRIAAKLKSHQQPGQDQRTVISSSTATTACLDSSASAPLSTSSPILLKSAPSFPTAVNKSSSSVAHGIVHSVNPVRQSSGVEVPFSTHRRDTFYCTSTEILELPPPVPLKERKNRSKSGTLPNPRRSSDLGGYNTVQMAVVYPHQHRRRSFSDNDFESSSGVRDAPVPPIRRKKSVLVIPNNNTQTHTPVLVIPGNNTQTHTPVLVIPSNNTQTHTPVLVIPSNNTQTHTPELELFKTDFSEQQPDFKNTFPSDFDERCQVSSEVGKRLIQFGNKSPIPFDAGRRRTDSSSFVEAETNDNYTMSDLDEALAEQAVEDGVERSTNYVVSEPHVSTSKSSKRNVESDDLDLSENDSDGYSKPPTAVPLHQPLIAIALDQSSNTVSLHQPSNTVALLKPSNTVSLDQPSNTVALPKPLNTVSLHQPSNTVALHKPSNTVSLDQASNTVALHKPSNTVLLHQPSNTEALHKPSNTVSLDQASNTVALPKPSNTVSLHQPSNTEALHKPSNTVSLDQASNTIPPHQPQTTVPLWRKSTESHLVSQPSLMASSPPLPASKPPVLASKPTRLTSTPPLSSSKPPILASKPTHLVSPTAPLVSKPSSVAQVHVASRSDHSPAHDSPASMSATTADSDAHASSPHESVTIPDSDAQAHLEENLESQLQEQQEHIAELKQRLNGLQQLVDTTSCVFPTSYQSMNHPDQVELMLSCTDGTVRRKGFLLDTGRLKLDIVLKAFTLSSLDVIIDGIPLTVGCNIDGYIPLRFESGSIVQVCGTQIVVPSAGGGCQNCREQQKKQHTICITQF